MRGITCVIVGLAVGLSAMGCNDAARCDFGTTTAAVAPSAGDGLVPLNSAIWMRVDGTTRLHCLEVHVDLIHLDVGSVDLPDPVLIESPERTLFRWDPPAELLPDADYEIQWSVDWAPSGSNVLDQGVASFRTGIEPAVIPPETPTPLTWRAELDGPLLGPTPDAATDYDDWLELWTTGGRFLLVETGAPDDDPDTAWRIGTFGHVWSPAPLTPRRTHELRFAAVDLAGQRSAWSPAVEWTVPAPSTVTRGGFVVEE